MNLYSQPTKYYSSFPVKKAKPSHGCGDLSSG